MRHRVPARRAALAAIGVAILTVGAWLYGFPPSIATVSAPQAAPDSAYRLALAQPPVPDGVTGGTGIAVVSDDAYYLLHRAGHGFAEDRLIERDAVLRYNADTDLVGARWGAGLLRSPHGLSVDQDGNLWITDVVLNQVLKFDADGRLLLRVGAEYPGGMEACLRVRNVLTNLPCFGDDDLLARPTDVAVASDGSFFVADGDRHARVVHFAADGTVVHEWGELGDGPDDLHLPHGSAVDAAGRVYVADRRNARISVFTSEGAPIAQWRSAEIGRPFDVQVTRDSVWVLDGGDALDDPGSPRAPQVVRLDFEGRVVDRFGWPAGAGPVAAHAIAIGPGGDVYVASVEGRPIWRFTSGVSGSNWSPSAGARGASGSTW